MIFAARFSPICGSLSSSAGVAVLMFTRPVFGGCAAGGAGAGAGAAGLAAGIVVIGFGGVCVVAWAIADDAPIGPASTALHIPARTSCFRCKAMPPSLWLRRPGGRSAKTIEASDRQPCNDGFAII